MKYLVSPATERTRKPRKSSQILHDALLRRFFAVAGHTNLIDTAHDRLRSFISDMIIDVMDRARTVAQHKLRTRILVADILAVLKSDGIAVYGFDDLCTVHHEEYQVTELVSELAWFATPECAEEQDKASSSSTSAKYVDRSKSLVQAFQESGHEDVDAADISSSEDESASESEASTESDEEETTAPRHDECRGGGTTSRIIDELYRAQSLLEDLVAVPSDEDAEKISRHDFPLGENLSESHDTISRIDALWETLPEYEGYYQIPSGLGDLVEEISSAEMDHICPRETFKELLERLCYTRYTVQLSNAALSALQYSTEDRIQRELSSGPLGYKIRTEVFAFMHREERSLRLQAEDRVRVLEERLKRLKDEKTSSDRTLNIQKVTPTDPSPRSKKKRKIEDEEPASNSTSGSIFSTIRSKLRKKSSKVNPV